MSHYPAWAYRQQLENKYRHILNNPLTDQQHAANIKRAIDEKVHEFVQKQKALNDLEVKRLKKDM